MPLAHAAYRPRDAEHSVLYAVIRDHLDDFLHEASARSGGDGQPEFVEREFREFLTCGVLAHGFARFRCEGCAFDRFVMYRVRVRTRVLRTVRRARTCRCASDARWAGR